MLVGTAAAELELEGFTSTEDHPPNDFWWKRLPEDAMGASVLEGYAVGPSVVPLP